MEEIFEIIRNDIENLNGEELKKKLLEYHPYDIATTLKELDDDLQKKVFDLLDASEAADIFEYFEAEDTADILEEMDIEKSTDILEEMETDDAADVINELDEDIKAEVIENIDEEVKEDIVELAKYEENVAGSIMTDNYLSLDVNMTVGKAMQKLVKESNDQEVIDVLFVLDNEKLIGTLDLKELIVARKQELIKDLMDENFKSVIDTDDINDAVDMIKEYNLLALPVVDNNGLMLGIITIDDAIDVVDEDVSENYDKMAGIVGDNTIKFFDVIKSRLLWLIILLFLSFVVSTVMDGFSSVISSVTCLVFFQSLLLDMGGNAGTQALATSVVEISKSQLDTKKDVLKHLGKEFLSGLLDAFVLAIIAFGMSLLFITIRKLDTAGYQSWTISLVIAMSMLVSLTISNFLGALVPILLNKLHIDPAVASGPFISTLNDIVSVCVYYTLAYIILVGGLL